MTSSSRRCLLVLCVVTAAVIVLSLYLFQPVSHTPATDSMPACPPFLTSATLHSDSRQNVPQHSPHSPNSLHPSVPKDSTQYSTGPEQAPEGTTEECPCLGDLEEAKVKNVAMEIETNDDAVVGFLLENKFQAQKGLGGRHETLDPEFEAPLFRYPPLRQAGCLPDHSRSKVFLLTPRDQLSVGGSVQFRIDIYNACGQPRSTGGDVIRAWLKSQDGNSSVAAKVKDLHNGSYVGESILLWPGVTLVRVSLTYAQEFMRLSVELYHSMHAMVWTTETLVGHSVKEVVPCMPFSPVPGYAKSCNFTDGNGGHPWFCGHPVTKGVNCDQRTVFNSLPYTVPLPVPPVFRCYVDQLTSCCPNKTHQDLRLIPNDIRLEASLGTLTFPPPLPPCSSRPLRDSWVGPSDSPSPSPRGWLRHGRWVPSTCTVPPFTEERVRRCMTNRTLLLLGDSNQRVLWYYIQAITGCNPDKQPYWNAPHICQNSTLQSTVVFAAHAFPFMPGTHGGFPIANLPLPLALDTVQRLSYQPDQDLTAVLHYFMHLSTHSVQVYRSFVHAARETVQEYLRVHPKAKVVIRGPHVLYQGNAHHVHIGDKFGEWYQRIWRQEFAPLADRVWYLDTWDLTIASENWEMHPMPVAKEIINMLFGYICDDK